MGRIGGGPERRSVWLRHRHVVGRAPTCDLVLDAPVVSTLHAAITWTDEGWVARDLGSRNGTFVDGVRLGPGLAAQLRRGSRLGFGQAASSHVLDDDAPPRPMARREDGDGEPVAADCNVLALPSEAAPLVTVYRGAGGWTVEGEDGVRRVGDLDRVVVDGHPWRLHLPDALAATAGPAGAEADLASATLRFQVSLDEEHVQAEVVVGGRRIDLQARAHHHALLYLARARLADAALPEPSRGWVYSDRAARDLSIGEGKLNLDVFRARRQLAEAGVATAGQLVERRTGSGQLRIGVGHLVVERG